MKGVLEDYRKVFHDLDEQYYDNPKPEVKKLNDDMMFAIKRAIKERYKLLGNATKAEKDLTNTLSTVEKKLKEVRGTGLTGLKKRLGTAIDTLGQKMEVVKKKYEEVKAERLNLEAKVKPLIKAGRIEEAEIFIPQINACEEAEQLYRNFIRAVGRTISRIRGLLTKISVLETMKSIQISKMDFEEVRELKEKAESALKDLNNLQAELGTILSMTSTGELSGTLTESEKRTLMRLVEEVGEVSEETKKYIEELEETERKFKDMLDK